jgi:hypothetical protein
MNFLTKFVRDLTKPPIDLDQNLLANILKSPNWDDFVLPCSVAHPETSCVYQGCQMATKYCTGLWKVYLFAHVGPILAFRRKELRREPRKYLLRAVKGFLLSMAYVSTHGMGGNFIFCWAKRIIRPGMNVALLIWIGFFLFTGSIHWEASGRVEEVALYIIPRFTQVITNYLAKKKIVNRDVGWLQCLLFGLSIGVACMSYNNESKQHMKEKYKNICKLIIGDDAAAKKPAQKVDKMGDEISLPINID